MFGCFSHNSPRITFWCTASICAWHWVQVLTMFCLAMEDCGSVWGSTWWAVWQLVHTAVTVRPFLYKPSPWMLSM